MAFIDNDIEENGSSGGHRTKIKFSCLKFVIFSYKYCSEQTLRNQNLKIMKKKDEKNLHK